MQPRHHDARQPFTTLTDREFFYFTRLGREDLLAAYIELKRFCWKGQSRCWPSVERQAQDTGRMVNTVRKRLNDLAQIGVIRVLSASETGRRGNEYVLLAPETWQWPAEGTDTPPVPDPANPLEGNQIKKINQETHNNHLDQVPPVDRPAEEAAAVVAPPFLDHVKDQLQALGVALTSSLLALCGCYDTRALQQALACLEAAKRVDNPPAFFRAALQGGWEPPASFVAAKARREAAAAAQQRQVPVDALARIWGRRLSMALDELVVEIQQDIARSERPLAVRVREWTELSWFRKDTAAARAEEEQHDARVRRALTETSAAGLTDLLGITLRSAA